MVGYGAQIQACSILSSRSRQPAEKKVDFFSYFIFSLGAENPLSPFFPSSRFETAYNFFIFRPGRGERSNREDGRRADKLSLVL